MNPPANARYVGRCPVGVHGNPLQYSCLKNFMNRERSLAATVQGVAKSQTQMGD